MLVHLNVTEPARKHTNLVSSGIPDVQRAVARIVDHHVNTSVIANSQNGAERDIRGSGVVSAADIPASRYLSSIPIGAVSVQRGELGIGGCGKQDYQGHKNISQDTNHLHPYDSKHSEDVTPCSSVSSTINCQMPLGKANESGGSPPTLPFPTYHRSPLFLALEASHD